MSRFQIVLNMALMVFTAFMFNGIVKDVTTYTSLKAQISSNRALLEQSESKKEELEETKKKLTNPDYLENVARGKYHLSRQGEQVFVFPGFDK